MTDITVLLAGPVRRAAFIALGVITLLAVLFTVNALPFDGPPAGSTLDLIVYTSIVGLSALVCVARGVHVRAERAAWLLMGVALGCWTAGEVWFDFVLPQDNIPFPSVADAGYLLAYPFAYLALWQLAKARIPNLQDAHWMDGLIGCLTVASISTALVFNPLAGLTGANAATASVTLAYPVGDLLLVGMLIGGFGMNGWRLGRSFTLIAVAWLLFWASDTAFLIGVSHNTYTPGTWMDLGWPWAAVLIAVAAWQQPRAFAFRALAPSGRLMTPLVATAVVLGLLIYGNRSPLNPLALTLAGGTVIALLWRMRQAFAGASTLLEEVTHVSMTDELTGLGNRRRLLEDLDRSLAQMHSGFDETGRAFLLFDLNGFKDYNDTFGHPAGDALLSRIGQRLAAAVRTDGAAYRLGGDEFCALLICDRTLDQQVQACIDALSERGEAYEIGAAYGMALLPADGPAVSDVMRRADQLMYAQKAKGRPAVSQQMRDVLLRALFERSIDLGEHNDDVAELSRACAIKLGLDGEQVDEVVRAAELHDVGKIAIPDSILLKPGPLSEAEWVQMRTHTIVGQRILAAAPALAPVGRLVRSSHERWDGGGYPDALAAEQIPLGARIVAACDAFDAMVSDRPYRDGMSYEDAIGELRACAGTQFDPRVVDALLAVLDQSRDLAARVASTPAA